MGTQGVQQTYKKKVPALNIAPYYGLSTTDAATEATVLSLQHRGTPGTFVLTFSLTAGVGQYQYFAYPESYGPCEFYDNDSSFTGGWDGANNDPFNIYGPIVVPVTVNSVIIPFYVYRTDHDDLGLCNWTTKVYTGS